MIKKVIVAKDSIEAKEIAKKYKNSNTKVVAVEAEWGDEALEEPLVDLSLNHHGSRHTNPCPAEIGLKKPEVLEEYFQENTVYIVSHLDADTIMGIMWLEQKITKTPEVVTLSEMIAFSDKNGYHIAEEHYSNLKDTDIYRKWLAMGYVFSRNSKTHPGDVTNRVNGIVYAITKIIANTNIKNMVVYKEAFEWKNRKITSAKSALVFKSDKLLGFSGKLFYCDNYNLLEDGKRDFIVQYDIENKNILLAAYNKEIAIKTFGKKGVVGVLQDFFGDKAGGHIGIGGTPRNHKYTYSDFQEFLEYVEKKINN